MRSNSLEQQLASRPPMEVLVKEGILKGELVMGDDEHVCAWMTDCVSVEDENPFKDD